MLKKCLIGACQKNEVICPHCVKVFKIDEAGYADILRQVRNSEFNSELHERLEHAEREKVAALALMEAKVTNAVKTETASKDAEIERLKAELAKLVVDGIHDEKIAGYVYELRELQEDGEEEKERFLDQLYRVQNGQKADFDYVVYDSDVERQFAELLDGREDIKLFMKLPDKFKIPTPVGPYNPDWAIIKHVDGDDRIYMIRETKSTLDDTKLRPTELAKIKSAKKHFAAIGVEEYDRSVPERWNL
jgi:restriction endonuclease